MSKPRQTQRILPYNYSNTAAPGALKQAEFFPFTPKMIEAPSRLKEPQLNQVQAVNQLDDRQVNQ